MMGRGSSNGRGLSSLPRGRGGNSSEFGLRGRGDASNGSGGRGSYRDGSSRQNGSLGHTNGNGPNAVDSENEILHSFGKRRLAEFLTQPNDEVISALDKSINNFKQNLNEDIGKDDDKLILLIQVIGEKVCGETSMPEIQNRLVALAADTKFLKKTLDFTLMLISLSSSSQSIRSNDVVADRSHLRVLKALSAFYGFISVRMQTLAVDALMPSIQALQNTNELLRLRKLVAEKESLELELRLSKMLEDLSICKEAKEKKPAEGESRPKPRRINQLSAADIEKLYLMKPDDFWDIDIVPTTQEIVSDDEPFLRPNLTRGKYPSAVTYLDVQFRLLREDFLAPLRDSVKEYLTHEVEYSSRKKRLPPGTIRFYHDVKLHKVECLQDMTLFAMKFSLTPALKRIKWDKSKRLINGSLLLLTADKFKTIYFATVARRNEKELLKGIIDIIWEGKRPDSYHDVTFLMVECEVYFESYRHTLRGLQEMAKPCPPLYDQPQFEKYPMKKYIVDMSTDQVRPPKYLLNISENLRMDFKMLLKSNAEGIKLLKEISEEEANRDNTKAARKVVLDPLLSRPPDLNPHQGNPLVPTEWPTASQLGMDEPQYLAFQSAITQELSIIQGPPGTGKTYIGLQIMKLLLSNPKITWSHPPEETKKQVPDTDSDEEFLEAPVGEDAERLYRRAKLLKLWQSRNLYESPILVVCYTNHALDQFLEGIISTMHSLNIDPIGNLVRVGGRSKVEVVQQYNIRELNRYYSRFKLFDKNYSQQRFRTRESLIELQNRRADLKSLYKDLCIPQGIVNFHEFSCFNPKLNSLLCDVLPEKLNEIFISTLRFKLVNWLGLNGVDFESSQFHPADQLRKWFRISHRLKLKLPMSNEEELPEEEELEDEELQHILQAHRLEEEIIMSDDRKVYKPARVPWIFQYENDFEFHANHQVLHLQLKDADPDRDWRKIKELEAELWQSQAQHRKYENQCEFLKELFKAYEDEVIELPKVTPGLLSRGHEKEAPLRPSWNEKWGMYFYFIEQAKKILLKEIMAVEEEIIRAQEKMMEVNNRGDGIILKKAKVVGMTTTGAAKYNTLLRMMKSRIVIVEEAAEVLEAHIITSITEHCEHLILIGDHKQLRPPTTVYKLAKDYNLDLSLFERLINNKLSWRYLKAQHRMRPEICKLLVPTIYKDLENHSSVWSYPPVAGFSKNLFFITHGQPERAETDSMTKSNEYEARYLAKLCRYLILQGYKPGHVTVLTTYIGQMFLIKKLMSSEGETCRGVRVTVVDNFQGEENDIILLSLVRSNPENKIGFLKTDNRICVALSRAKQGLFVIGNMDCLVGSKSKTWESISNDLRSQGCIGDKIKLVCQNHGEMMEIGSPEDFQLKSPEGGCSKMCPGVLPKCNHTCQKVCHVLDREHEEYQCKFPCERLCPDPAKHSCPHPCFKECPSCSVIVPRDLSCGHKCYLNCHVNYLKYSCFQPVEKKLLCDHKLKLPCYIPVASVNCEVRMDKTLECGHVKTLPCHVPTVSFECKEVVDKPLECGHTGRMKCIEDPDKFICDILCRKRLPCGHKQVAPCNADIQAVHCQTLLTVNKPDCGHEVEIPCYLAKEPEKWTCISMCDTRLDCGHQCTKNCHLQDDPTHLTLRCRKTCARSCENEHPCRAKHACFERCPPCNVRTDRTLACGHVVSMNCSADLSNWKCKEPCKRKVEGCYKGHLCVKKCWENCSPCAVIVEKHSIDCAHTITVKCHIPADKSLCEEMVPAAMTSKCGHVVEVPCRIQDTCRAEDGLKFCHQPCGFVFSTEEDGCGHTCQGDCSSCFQGRLHVKCQEKCGRVLACGHVCKHPCSSLCPPCEERCILQCNHSTCKKKCGEPCAGCNERCKWVCEHQKCTKKCRDQCNRGPCNEPCKKKLKTCEHDCIGSCGEPCPPLCRVCNKEAVQEIMFGPEDEDDARFVYLSDCKHVVHRESMDSWMETEQNSKEIGVKRCPKCSAIITQSVRYGNILKKKLEGVLAVRKKIFGNTALMKTVQGQVANQLQFSNEYEFEFVRDLLEKRLYRMERGPTKKGFRLCRVLLEVDQYTFGSLHSFVMWWKEAEKNVKLKPITTPPPSQPPREIRRLNTFGRQELPPQPQVRQDLTREYRQFLIQKYTEIFKILLDRKLPLSSQEINDFDIEFERLHDFYRLGLRQGVDEFGTYNGAQFMFNSAKETLSLSQPYDSQRKEALSNQLQSLEALIKAGWEASYKKRRVDDVRASRAEIFTAMGFAGNHWYRCSQGHLYVVADCGALNGTGQCPDCRGTIGRGSTNIYAVRDEAAIRAQIAGVDDVVEIGDLPPAPSFSFPGEASGVRNGRRGQNKIGRGGGQKKLD